MISEMTFSEAELHILVCWADYCDDRLDSLSPEEDELRKRIQQEYEEVVMERKRKESGEQVTIKAYDGNRAANLRGIGEALRDYACLFRKFDCLHAGRSLEGYAEQLGIIAHEIEGKKDE